MGSLGKADENTAGNIEYFLSKEVTNLKFLDLSASINTASNVFKMTYNTGASNIPGFPGATAFIDGTTPRKYLYSTANKVVSTSNLTFVAQANQTLAEKFIWPSDVYYDNVYNVPIKDHHLEIRLQKRWFSPGKWITNYAAANFADTCYTAWRVGANSNFNFSEAIDFGANASPDITAKNTAVWGLPTYKVNRQYLFQSNLTNTNIQSATITGEVTNYVITAKPNVDSLNNVLYRWPCAGNCGDATTNEYFGFFTNCVLHRTDFPVRKIFDYFEVVMVYSNAVKRPKRMIRFISYLPMTGIFDDGPNATDYNNANTVDYHQNVDYAVGSQNVCVLKIGKDNFLNPTTDGNVFLLYLWNIHLFETDFTSYTNTYPISNLKTGAKAYAISTALPLQSNDFRIVNQTYNSVPVEFADKDIPDFFLFASQLWFNGVSETEVTLNGTNTDDLYVPHYCSEAFADGNVSINMAVGQWIFSNSYDNVENIKRRLVDGTGKKYFKANSTNIMKEASFDNISFYAYAEYSPLNTAGNTITAVPTKHVKAAGSTVNTYSTLGYLVYLLSSTIELDAAVTISNLGTQPTRSIIGIPFYFMGKMFNKLIFGHMENNVEFYDTTTASANSAQFSITGVKRPPITTLVSSTGTISLPNHIVISGGDKTAGKRISNLWSGSYYISIKQGTYNWTVAYSAIDTAYYETSGSIQFTLINPTTVGTLDNFTFPAMNPISFEIPNTLATTAFCVLDDFSETYQMHARACTFDGTSKFSCTKGASSNSFKFCCYNLALITATTSFGLTAVNVNYTSPSTTYVNYNTFAQTVFGTALAFITTAYPQPVFTTYRFPHSMSKMGMSNMWITIDLKKRLDYDIEIKIEGDFSTLSLYKVNPMCVATTSSDFKFGNWNMGDNIIEGCSIENWSSNPGRVRIITKKNAYSCSQVNNTFVYVNIWPVSPNDVNLIKYKTIVSRNSTTTAIITPADGVVSAGSVAADTVIQVDTVLTDVTTLCNLKTIYPLIIGINATYTFELDYTSKKTELAALPSFPNELTIALPDNYFASYDGEYIKCSVDIDKVLDVDCNIRGAFLSVNLKNSNFSKATSKVLITIYNMKVPHLPANALTFHCSLNNLTWAGERKVVLTGRGKYSGSIINSMALTHLLNYDNSAEYSFSTFEPRTGAFTIKFGVMFDKAGGKDLVDRVLDKDPFFAFELPLSYSNTKYLMTDVTSSFTIDIRQVLRNTAAPGFALLPPQSIASANLMSYGNTIKVPIVSNHLTDKTIFNLSKETIYYLVDISGVLPPEMEIKSAGTINVFLTNDVSSYLFRTYRNIINSYTVRDPAMTGLENFYRGYNFTYSKMHWVLNFVQQGTDMKNHLHLVAGYYNPVELEQHVFNSLDVKSDTAEINLTGELTHKIWQNNMVSDKNIIRFVSSMRKNHFSIGIPCKTAPGRYLLKVNVNNATKSIKFVTEMHIYVNVIHKPMSITCANPLASASKDSTYSFNCTNPWPIYDTYALTFTNSNTADNFSGTTVTVEQYMRHNRVNISTKFTLNKPTTTNIGFTITTKNECVNINDKASALFTLPLNDTVPAVVTAAHLDDLIFQTTVNDASIPQNSIRFSFIFPETSHIACVVACANITLPTDDKIESLAGLVASDSLQFFKLYSTSNTALHTELVHMIRSMTNYQARCVIKSGNTIGDVSKFFKTFTNIRKERVAAATLSAISIAPTPPSKCIQYLSTAAINDLHKQELVNYCQMSFENTNGMGHGCVMCADLMNTIKPAGVSLTPMTCAATAGRVLRFLQREVIEVRQLQTASMSYIVCPLLNILCHNAPLTEAQYQTQVTGLLDATKTEKLTALLAKAAPVTVTTNEIIQDAALPVFKICTATTPVAEVTNGCVTVSNVSIKYEGSVTATVSLRGNFVCSWNTLLKEGAAPAASAVATCNNGKCGAFRTITNVPVTLSSSSTTVKERTKTYAIYMTCSANNVLWPRFSSTVVLELGSQAFPKSAHPCPKPELDTTPDLSKCSCIDADDNVIDQGTDGMLCTSGYLALSLVLSFILLFI